MVNGKLSTLPIFTRSMIYLDNNTTTHIEPEVSDAMMAFLNASVGNSPSATLDGKVLAAIENARVSVARLKGAANVSEIVFTTGGTENDYPAIVGALETDRNRKHVVTTNVENESAQNLFAELEKKGILVTRIGVDSDGLIDPQEIAAAVTAQTAIVSVSHANSETGVLSPVEEIASLVKQRSDALVYVDGTDAAGKIFIDLKNTDIDIYSISGHKFHGPKGIGAVYIRTNSPLRRWFTDSFLESEQDIEGVRLIVGLGVAADLANDFGKSKAVQLLRDKLENKILEKIPNSRLNGTRDAARRLPNTSNISFENTNGEAILARLEDLGIHISTGCACASFDHNASPVLQAMNVPYSYAMGSIRFSLSRYTTAAEVDRVIDVMPGIIANLRSLSGQT